MQKRPEEIFLHDIVIRRAAISEMLDMVDQCCSQTEEPQFCQVFVAAWLVVWNFLKSLFILVQIRIIRFRLEDFKIGKNIQRCAEGCSDINECLVHNGGCQHKCVNTRGSFHCQCDPGFRLHVDRRTCIGVSLCGVSNGGCEHFCIQQSAVQIQCRCRPNYRLAEDGKHCT
ncbi:multiple epidermal growth factor-like domains protein 6 isoform X3, partial [Tachysurus ichikawai]